MKILSRERLNDLSRTLSEAVRHYPVELGLCLYAFVIFALTRESVLGERNYELLTAVPLCITLAYVLNSLFTTGRGRLIYYLAWIVALPAATLLPSHPSGSTSLTRSRSGSPMRCMASGSVRAR